MKRLLPTLLVAILATLLFCVPVLADLYHVPHEDPGVAESALDARSLLWYYGDVLEMVSVREYVRADGLIQRLDYANILEEYRDVVDRYSDLASGLLVTLDDLDGALDEASSLLWQYRLSVRRRTAPGTARLEKHSPSTVSGPAGHGTPVAGAAAKLTSVAVILAVSPSRIHAHWRDGGI